MGKQRTQMYKTIIGSLNTYNFHKQPVGLQCLVQFNMLKCYTIYPTRIQLNIV